MGINKSVLMIRALIAANNNRTNHQHREGTRVRNSSSGAHQLHVLSTERAELQRNRAENRLLNIIIIFVA